jgi:hypothetical protein
LRKPSTTAAAKRLATGIGIALPAVTHVIALVIVVFAFDAYRCILIFSAVVVGFAFISHYLALHFLASSSSSSLRFKLTGRSRNGQNGGCGRLSMIAAG